MPDGVLVPSIMVPQDIRALRSGRGCCAQKQNGNEPLKGTLPADMSRRRQRPTGNIIALPLVVITLFLLRPSDAFAVRSHTYHIPGQNIEMDLAGRFPTMTERAHRVSPTRRRHHGTMPPPRRKATLATLLGSTPSDSIDEKANSQSNKELDSGGQNKTIAQTNTFASPSDVTDLDVEKTNNNTEFTNDESIAKAANKSVGVVGKDDVGQFDRSNRSFVTTNDNSQQREENGERLIELRQRATAYVAKLHLSEILRRIDRRGLRYGPSSSQEDLEMMLVDALVGERSDGDTVAEEAKSRRSRRSDDNEDEDEEEPLYEPRRRGRNRMSKRERRRQRLDQSDEPIVPKTLRDVARVASRAVQPVDRVVSKTLWGVVEGDVGKKAKKVGRRVKRVTVDVAGNVAGGVGEVVGGVKRKGSSIRNGSTRVIRVDENGIAEPDWSYVRQDNLDNGSRGADQGDEQRGYKYMYREAASKRGGAKSRRRGQPSSRRVEDEPFNIQEEEGSEFSWADYAVPFHTPAGPPKNNRKFHMSRKEQRISRRRPLSDVDEEYFADTSESQNAPLPSDGTFLALPPASTDDGLPFNPLNANDMGPSYSTGRKRRRNKRRSGERNEGRNGEKRKIYSVYDPSEDEGLNADVFDEFGNRLADVAENMLWGDEGNNEPNSEYPKRDVNARRRKTRRSKSGAAALNDGNPYEEDLQPKRHWRDRLADRLDAAMGVHEKGSYYQEWADRIEFDEETKVGDDPEDWVMGRHKNQRRMGLTPEEREARRRPNRSKPNRRGGVDKYFWNQDGNVMSALLGRSRSGNRAAIDELFSQPLGANVITTLIRSGFQLSLALFTNTCRWASVRGSLPQPIVVFFTGTSLVLAPKGKRLVTTAVTLFALRALAEALHGYIYGPDGWEDDPDNLFIDDDYENDDFGEEYQEGFEPSPPRNHRRRRSSHNGSVDDDETSSS